jgi:hypothetical protein
LQKPAQPSASTTFRPQEKTPSPSKKPQTLKEELEARLGNEYESEVRDTIQAILASLAHPQPAAPAQKPHAATVPSSANEQGKGKGKNGSDSVKIPVFSTPSNEVHSSLQTIQSIETSFHVLEDDFTMPRQLDFQSSSISGDDTNSSDEGTVTASPKLSFTSVNAPIHNYTHALSQLLNQLDAIESFGSEEVRARRKLVVEMVEKALEGVESEIEQKGNLSRRQSQAFVSHTSTQLEQDVERAVPILEGTVESTARPSIPDILVHAAPIDDSESVVLSTEDLGEVTPVFEDSAPLAVNDVAETGELHNSVLMESTTPEPVLSRETSNEDVEDLSSTLRPAPTGFHVDKSEDNLTAADADEVAPYIVFDEHQSGDIPTSTLGASSADLSVRSSEDDSIASRPAEEIDTFLLPAYSESSSPAGNNAAVEDDLVVVEENSDKDGWSDLEA